MQPRPTGIEEAEALKAHGQRLGPHSLGTNRADDPPRARVQGCVSVALLITREPITRATRRIIGERVEALLLILRAKAIGSAHRLSGILGPNMGDDRRQVTGPVLERRDRGTDSALAGDSVSRAERAVGGGVIRRGGRGFWWGGARRHLRGGSPSRGVPGR